MWIERFNIFYPHSILLQSFAEMHETGRVATWPVFYCKFGRRRYFSNQCLKPVF